MNTFILNFSCSLNYQNCRKKEQIASLVNEVMDRETTSFAFQATAIKTQKQVLKVQ